MILEFSGDAILRGIQKILRRKRLSKTDYYLKGLSLAMKQVAGILYNPKKSHLKVVEKTEIKVGLIERNIFLSLSKRGDEIILWLALHLICTQIAPAYRCARTGSAGRHFAAGRQQCPAIFQPV